MMPAWLARTCAHKLQRAAAGNAAASAYVAHTSLAVERRTPYFPANRHATSKRRVLASRLPLLPRMQSNARDEQGFSLIEVLIASGILAAAAVSLSGLCLTAADALLAAKQRSIAAMLASGRLEELLADTDALRSGIDAGDRVNASGGSEPDAGGWYLRRWRVTASPALPERLVVVSVLVTSPAGTRLQLHDIRLTTVAERPR